MYTVIYLLIVRDRRVRGGFKSRPWLKFFAIFTSTNTFVLIRHKNHAHTHISDDLGQGRQTLIIGPFGTQYTHIKNCLVLMYANYWTLLNFTDAPVRQNISILWLIIGTHPNARAREIYTRAFVVKFIANRLTAPGEDLYENGVRL